MKKLVSVLLLMTMICGVSFATSSSKGVNTTSDLIVDQIITNTNTINSIKVNSVMQTVIMENATTGYTWKVSIEGDSKAVQVSFNPEEVSKDQKNGSNQLVGAGVNKVLKIKGIKKGNATVKLTLSRVWEKGVQPIETRLYTIEVK